MAHSEFGLIYSNYSFHTVTVTDKTQINDALKSLILNLFLNSKT